MIALAWMIIVLDVITFFGGVWWFIFFAIVAALIAVPGSDAAGGVSFLIAIAPWAWFLFCLAVEGEARRRWEQRRSDEDDRDC